MAAHWRMPKGKVYGRHADTPRTVRLHIRLTEQERLDLTAIAENCGKTVSSLVRDTILQIMSSSRAVRRILSEPLHLSRMRISYALKRRNGELLTEQNGMNGEKLARVQVSKEVSVTREQSIARKTGHSPACKCVECENLRSLFRLADGRPQTKPPKRRTPKPQ